MKQKSPGPEPPEPKVIIEKKPRGTDGGFWPLLAGVLGAILLIVFIMQNMIPVPLNFYGARLGEYRAAGPAVSGQGDGQGSPADEDPSSALPAAPQYLVSGGIPVWLLVFICVAFGFAGGRLVPRRRRKPAGKKKFS